MYTYGRITFNEFNTIIDQAVNKKIKIIMKLKIMMKIYLFLILMKNL